MYPKELFQPGKSSHVPLLGSKGAAVGACEGGRGVVMAGPLGARVVTPGVVPATAQVGTSVGAAEGAGVTPWCPPPQAQHACVASIPPTAKSANAPQLGLHPGPVDPSNKHHPASA